MLASAVSSKLLGAMAEKEGFVFVETLTGFKWLGNTAMRLEREQVRGAATPWAGQSPGGCGGAPHALNRTLAC